MILRHSLSPLDWHGQDHWGKLCSCKEAPCKSPLQMVCIGLWCCCMNVWHHLAHDWNLCQILANEGVANQEIVLKFEGKWITYLKSDSFVYSNSKFSWIGRYFLSRNFIIEKGKVWRSFTKICSMKNQSWIPNFQEFSNI